MSAQTLKVLSTLLQSPAELSGAQIAGVSKLATGTLYPILIRLEKAGWLVSRWETEDPHRLGRPRRRFYRLTAQGVARAVVAFDELRPTIGRLAWS